MSIKEARPRGFEALAATASAAISARRHCKRSGLGSGHGKTRPDMLYCAAPRLVLLAAPVRPRCFIGTTIVRLVRVEAAARPQAEEPAKRKRTHVAYPTSLFVKHKMPEALTSYPDLSGRERMAIIMGWWKAASPEEQKPYRDEFENLKQEKEAVKKRVKATTTLSAYQLYMKEGMAEAKDNGASDMQQVFVKLASSWRGLPAATKDEYQRRALARNAQIWQDLDQEQLA
ncbi:hypothetical protein QJQ45_014454 [Haematococcus lacustris]|nr:hypothetical protein QJQ45_014454 [Haematococcus lacustris]